MSAGLRAVSFGTLDGSLWAVAADADGAVALVLGGGPAVASVDGLSLSDPGSGGDAWRLDGDGVALAVTRVAAPPHDAVPDATPSRPTSAPGQSLCRVRGTVTLAGTERPVDCVGTRAASSTAAGGPASARLVSAWFSDTEALTLLAVRPPGVEHHDADAVAATLFDADGWIAVADPRLSTTYDGEGRPTRTNLELWIGEGEEELPRRIAGEVAGPGDSVAGAGFALRVSPLRCHSRGQDGSGVYALVTW